jgi:hypothetical protein
LAHGPDPAARSLTLLVPGLLGFAVNFPTDADPEPRIPALETCLSRADAHPGLTGDLEAQVFALFGIDPLPDADLPVAAVTRVLDLGVIDKGWWLRADPVHLQPQRDRLILLDTQAVSLSQDEANRLAAELIEAYGEEGWLLKAPRPGRWYFKPPRTPRIITTPLPQVVGKDIHPYLPQGKDGKTWHTILNEMQILLHTASVNAEREQRGDLPINSLWFWGGGRLPNISAVDWVHVHSEEPVSLALARLSEIPGGACPKSFVDWDRQAQRAGAHLVVLDHGRGAVQYTEMKQWRDFIERLDGEWMAPLFQAVKSGSLEQLVIYTDNGRAYRLRRSQARRWWRRRRSLAAHR